jgi:hypothetical protein
MFNRLKKTFGAGEQDPRKPVEPEPVFRPAKLPPKRQESPPTHKIVRCDTQLVNSEDGPKSVIILGADLYEASALEKLMSELVERFKVHRMISPPDTSLMVITIIGPCEVLDVAARWRKLAAADEVTAFWMSRMEKADIGVGSATAAPISAVYHSILPDVHL